MIKRYMAPYILSHFRPHFTLLTEVPPDKQVQIDQRLGEELRRRKLAGSLEIEINRLAIMMYGKKSGDSPPVGPNWEVREWVPCRAIRVRQKRSVPEASGHLRPG